MRSSHTVLGSYRADAPVCSTGKGTTFYSWLDVSSTASTAEISKAYRKKSLQLQYVQVILDVP